MSDIVARLKEAVEGGSADRELLKDALREMTAMKEKEDALEEILIILARTGFPWDENGRPGDGFALFQERYHRLLREASDILGLDLRSTITRTEPPTI